MHPTSILGSLRNGLRRGCANRSGSAAVEFALIAPVLLLIVLGTLIVGLHLGLSHSLQQLAGGAARAAVAGMSDAERDSLARAYLDRSLRAYGLIKPDNLQVSTGPDDDAPDVFVVTLLYDASDLGLNAFERLVPVPLASIVRSASVRRGGA